MNGLAKRARLHFTVLAMTAVLVSAVALFFICSISPVRAASINVRLAPDVVKKFPHLRKVLDRLLETLSTPAPWGTSWNQKLPYTGLFAVEKYTIGQINADFVRYLNDGKLRMDIKIDAGKNMRAAADTYCYSTFSASDVGIQLHQSAGSWRSQTAPYSDYDLAITIYHELLHVWQFHHEVAPSCYVFTKEKPAYFIEAYLPKRLFDVTTCPDPGGATPVACGDAGAR